MAQSLHQFFNPCSLDDNEQIPAKIWELLRRNSEFRNTVQRLSELDAKERNDYEKTGKYHGTAWGKSWRLLRRVNSQHPFSGVALQWLVPEPLFRCIVQTVPRGKKWKHRPVFAPRILRVGEGTTPNVKDKRWVWRAPGKRYISGLSIRRGPEVIWTDSDVKVFRSLVNPFREWKEYVWPFTVEHSWADAPPHFRRKFQFIWRSQFDCRPVNPLTGQRNDSPSPHESTFFRDWNLQDFRASGQVIQRDMAQVVRFKNLSCNYRVFAIPKTILTKGSAEEMGDWLAAELKKGSDLYGDLLKGKLLNEGEIFGTTSEWADWLSRVPRSTTGTARDTHFYRRCRYIQSLIDSIYPIFDPGKLLAPPTHRARGKKYVRKK